MSSLKFGTSGLRGLVTDLVGPPAYSYTAAFADVLKTDKRNQSSNQAIFIGQDLRPSSPKIAALCAAAIVSRGFKAFNCGAIPTPALAYSAMRAGAPAIMITGSHIPDDRNGLKFYLASGEIKKSDEVAIAAQQAALGISKIPDIDTAGSMLASPIDAVAAYRTRYENFFGRLALDGLKVGVYQHSSVARDIIVDLLTSLGAQAMPLGRSDRFVPVDTEAIRAEDEALALRWAQDMRFDAIVSTDGDADRPLIADGSGHFLRGDLVGALTARHLGVSMIVTPITSNSALETCGAFSRVIRTRVGSPYVIADMMEAASAMNGPVIGFEANGGVLLGSDIVRDGKRLEALPTRDAVLPIISVLMEILQRRQSLKDIGDALHFAHAASTRIEHVDTDRSTQFLQKLKDDKNFARSFFATLGGVRDFSAVDGVRFHLANDETVHFRASGNAPELRVYVEAASAERASARLEWALAEAKANLA